VKINYLAKKILLTKHEAFKNNNLVVNLVQMLVCFTLIAILRMSKVNIFPGRDYSLVCFCFFFIKTLQLRRESFFQDLFGLLPIALLSSSLYLNTFGSIFQVSSMFLNRVLFLIPLPAFIIAFFVVTQSTLHVISLVSPYSVLSCVSALFVLISLKVPKAYFIVIILFWALISMTLPSYSCLKDFRIIKYSASSKLSHETIHCVDIFHADSIEFKKSAQAGQIARNFSGDIRYVLANKLRNLELQKEDSNMNDDCNDGSIVYWNQTALLEPWVKNNKTGDETFKTGVEHSLYERINDEKQLSGGVEENMTVDSSSQNTVTPGDDDAEKYIDLPSCNENTIHDKDGESISVHEENQNEDKYYVLSSEVTSSGHCSVEVTDMSNWSFFLNKFVQLNQLFRQILPSVPSYKPFQLKKISLLGFSHLCLSLPGSEVSLINLGEEEDKSSNESEGNGESCQCNASQSDSLTNRLSYFITEFGSIVMSYFFMPY